MAPLENRQWVYNGTVPSGALQPRQSLELKSSTLDPSTVSLSGGLLLRTLVLSVDPYLRGRIRPQDEPSYAPPFAVGEPIDNFFVGRVERSEMEGWTKGDLAYGFGKFVEWDVVKPEQVKERRLIKLENKEKLPLTYWVGAAGMPGKTAHFGFYNHGRPKKGETIFVTAASGAVGQLVCQFAKREGLRVIASAGSEGKIKFLRDALGVDVVFNYKKEKTADVLKREGGIDIYWDNVGGQLLDDALAHMKRRGRIVACGAISEYEAEGEGIRHTGRMFAYEISWNGFIILNEPQWDEKFYADVPGAIARGEIKVVEDVTVGFENVEKAFLTILSGSNLGKAVIKVAD